MSSLLPVAQGGTNKLPAHLQHLADGKHTASDLVSTHIGLPSISIRGKQFRFKQGEKETSLPMGVPLDCVILGVDPVGKGVFNKSYYKGAYNPGDDSAPDCFSNNGVTPDPYVTAPVSQSCATCPMNAFGSGRDSQGNPSKGKACSDNKLLIVALADDLEGTIFQIRIPPTSLKALSSYGAQIGQTGATPYMLVTDITFADSEHPQLEFKGKRWLEESEVETVKARLDAGEIDAILPSKLVIPATNVPAEPKQDLLPPPADSVPPVEDIPAPEVPKVLTLTAKAPAGATIEAFTAKGWTEEMLIKNGYAEYK